MTGVGLEPTTLRVNIPVLNQLNYPSLCWQAPYYLVNIFIRACQSEAIQPLAAMYSQGSHPSLQYNLGLGQDL